jgi:hypothetical protein
MAGHGFVMQEDGLMARHGCVMHPPAGLPTCSIIHFSHIEKAGGTTIRQWLSALQGILGYGFLSTYNPGYDLPSMPGRDEYRDSATGLSRTPLVRTHLQDGGFRMLMERWSAELASLPPGAPVPAARAWRVAREYHDRDHWHWEKLLKNLTFYRPLAHEHGCHTPLVALVREPRTYYVSHHVFMTGKFYSNVDSHNLGRRPGAGRHLLSMEQYVRTLPNHQARWLTGKMNLKSQQLATFISGKIDVLGTTESMGDFVRATCQAAGLPVELCLSRIGHAKLSDTLCYKGLRHVLRQNDTRVLGPSGPLATTSEVQVRCKDSRSLYRQMAASEAMAAAVQQWAPLDLELYALARAATAAWRANAPPEWLAPSLGGDALPVRFKGALHPPGAEVKSNASIVRVGRWCQRLRSKAPYPVIDMQRLPPKSGGMGGNNTCVLVQV